MTKQIASTLLGKVDTGFKISKKTFIIQLGVYSAVAMSCVNHTEWSVLVWGLVYVQPSSEGFSRYRVAVLPTNKQGDISAFNYIHCQQSSMLLQQMIS